MEKEILFKIQIALSIFYFIFIFWSNKKHFTEKTIWKPVYFFSQWNC